MRATPSQMTSGKPRGHVLSGNDVEFLLAQGLQLEPYAEFYSATAWSIARGSDPTDMIRQFDDDSLYISKTNVNPAGAFSLPKLPYLFFGKIKSAKIKIRVKADGTTPVFSVNITDTSDDQIIDAAKTFSVAAADTWETYTFYAPVDIVDGRGAMSSPFLLVLAASSNTANTVYVGGVEVTFFGFDTP